MRSFRIQFVTLIFTAIHFSHQGISAAGVVDGRRPIYNIAHMVNSLQEITFNLDQGANALELDVSFEQDGTVKWIYHGPICDCFRECNNKAEFAEYLDYIKNITTPGSSVFRREMTFLFLDLKVSTIHDYAHAGETLALELLKHLWTQDLPMSQVYVLLSIGNKNGVDVLKYAFERLELNLTDSFMKKYIGIDVGTNEDISDIIAMWNKLNISRNAWLGDGTMNCFSPFWPVDRTLRALKERESSQLFRKVFKWTIDNSQDLEYYLNLGVDAIITNKPGNLAKVLSGTDIRLTHRLATSKDNPWEKFSPNSLQEE